MKMTLNAVMALLMMTVVPVSQVRAETSGVKDAINQLNFNLTVQWDQKDMSFRQKSIDQFMEKVKGLPKEEVVAALKTQMPNAQLADDVERLAKLAKEKNLNAEQTNALVMNSMSNLKTTGASWSDNATIAAVAGAIVIIVVAVILSGGSVSASASPSYDYYYDGYYYNYCGYDNYGYYYCY